MKKIFIRSPYFIEVNEAFQTSAKIEVFLWNKGDTEPTTPNYTLTKAVPSPSQTDIAWNVSNFAVEFIKPIAPIVSSALYPAEEDVECWCYMKVVRYSDDEELDDETFVCLNGYTNYLDGYNQSITQSVIGLSGNQKIYYNEKIYYLNVWSDTNEEFDTQVKWYNGSTLIETSTILASADEASLFVVPIRNNTTKMEIIQESIYAEIYFEQLCEPKYTPIVCKFINRFGGWQFLTFFKASSSGIEVKSKDYNLLPSSIDFNPLQGIKQRFNFQGTQKIKCNTGWVDENYSELIQDLLLSQVVLLDNKPAIVKSQSADIKTHLKDRNINYEVEFEYNYGLINDVI